MVTVEGLVTKALPDGKYLVEVEYKGKKREFICYVGGRVRLNHIIISEGDKVKIEISTYDPAQGKIIYRNR